jgi:CDP-4-dehydro-6-deoxyglucose reductase, E1
MSLEKRERKLCMFYDFHFNSWNEDEMKAILRVLRSGQFAMGESVAQFETQFANKFGTKYAVMVNSGSSANLISIASLFYKKDRPLKRGDEVIVPAVGWSTTYFPLQQYGLKLKFVDVEADTLNMDVNQLDKAVSPKTKLIVVANMLGNPATLDAIKAICKRFGLYLFEDNCESMGAEFKSIKCGMWGDIGSFSTSHSNHMSTMEGGVIATDDKELYHLARCLRAHGSNKNLPPESPIFTKESGVPQGALRFLFPGYNACPLDLAGAIGSEQLKKLDGMLEVRRQNACLLQDLLKNDERFILQRENGRSSWGSFSVLLHPRWNVEPQKVFEKLKDADIEHKPITGGNFLRHPAIRFFDHEVVGDMRIANLVHDRGFMVGNHAQDLTRQIERLYKTLASLAGAMNARKAA